MRFTGAYLSLSLSRHNLKGLPLSCKCLVSFLDCMDKDWVGGCRGRAISRNAAADEQSLVYYAGETLVEACRPLQKDEKKPPFSCTSMQLHLSRRPPSAYFHVCSVNTAFFDQYKQACPWPKVQTAHCSIPCQMLHD